MRHPILLHEYFDETVLKFPDKEALIFEDQRYTYSDIYTQANWLSRSLMNLGMKPHDRVLIYMDNAPEVFISLYGILKAGGIFVIINTSVQLQKLSYIIRDCEPSVIIAETKKGEHIISALQTNRMNTPVIWTRSSAAADPEAIRNKLGYKWEKMLLPGEGLEQQPPERFSNRVLDLDLAALIYTSGSTGDPKGVMESHFNIISAARSITRYLNNTPDDIILNTLPLSFDYGLYQAIMTFLFGGTLVLEKSFIFLTRTLNTIAREKVTGFPIVPTIVAMILKTIDLNSFHLKSLRYITNTGAAFPIEHIKRLRSLLPWVKIFSMFGLTECKRISYLPPEYIDIKPDSVGIAMPNCEVFIVDEKGQRVAPGETGELVVRGSNVMQGYWKAPEQTNRTFRQALGFRDKLLFTGDYFKMDSEGFLYFLGRKDDMIKSRGERISAKEIENILSQIEGVAESAVIGVDDDILGQAIKAFIVTKPGMPVNRKDILTYCAKNLEPYCIPKHIDFVDELPKSPHGKIDKKKLGKDQSKLSSVNTDYQKKVTNPIQKT